MLDIRAKIDRHSNAISIALLGILWLTAITMFFVIVLGIFKIIVGIYLEFQYLKLELEHLKPTINENNGLIAILKGLELIFIAPLIYLLVLSLTKYISAVSPAKIPISEKKDFNDQRKDYINLRKDYVNLAIMEIMNVKILITGIFISVLILHSLTFILEDTFHKPPLIFILALLIILIIYYFFLDILVEKFRKKE